MKNKQNLLNLTRFGAVAILFFTVFFNGSGCGKKPTDANELEFPASHLSYSQHIREIFLRDCTTSGCHQTGNPAAGLDLETPVPTFMSSNRLVVFPNDAQASPLYRVLLGPYLGIPQMPKDRAELSDAKRTAIRTWINEGANINN